MLEVAVGRYLDTAEIQVDVQPLFVRCLIRGRLLQVHTPEVRTEQASGHLYDVADLHVNVCRKCVQATARANARLSRARWW